MTKKIIPLSFLLALFFLTGCITTKKQVDTSSFDGGVFKSADKGSTWQQRVLIPTTTGKPQRISGSNVIWMSIDPNDSNAIYYGSIGNGLLYTLDGAGSWNAVNNLGKASIRTVEVSPDDKCTVYVSINNVVKKSSDCMRSWRDVYYDNNRSVAITALAIDHENTQVVYIGTSQGYMIKSIDGGDNWQSMDRLESRIERIVINPNDNQNIYVATRNKGVFLTRDGGAEWINLKKEMNNNKLGLSTKDVVFAKEEPSFVFISTSAGIMKSMDFGENWEKVDIVPQDKKVRINTMTVNPNNINEIYYATYTTFHRTLDGGENWSSMKLPTSRAGWRLLIDPKKPNVLYLGVRAFQKK